MMKMNLKKQKIWVNKNCKEGEDINPGEKQFDRKQKDKDWEFVIKMTMIIRDLMSGNEKLVQKDLEKKRRDIMQSYQVSRASVNGQIFT